MKIKLALFLIISALASLGATIHEHYVGITEIRYSPDSETYQISLKLFTDDLENAILKSYGDYLDLGGKNESLKSDSLIFLYLERHFSIKLASGEIFKLSKVGRETDLNISWIYYESNKTKPLEALKVKNSIFMEMHTDQTHVVNVVQHGKTVSTLLHTAKREDLLKL